MVFETLGVAWGYVFVIVIAGCSLIIGYYKGKGFIKFPLNNPVGKTKKEKQATEEKETEQKSTTETEFAVPPSDDDDGEKKD
jgi:hypothetical protein